MKKVEWIEQAIKLGLGTFTKDGALVVSTGAHTGRETQRRFIARTPETETRINWSDTNKPIASDLAAQLRSGLSRKFENEKVYGYSGFVGPFPINVFSLSPWHAAFAANMFRAEPTNLSLPKDASASITILHDPYGKMSQLGVDFGSEHGIVLDPSQMLVMIVGTAYAGEIKKSAFTLCNYRLPDYGQLPMHASANCLADGSNTCVLFGLSGTGKTTLSAAPDRFLIGDDEIIWSPSGLSNLEGGCYAKLIDLTVEREPEIFRAANQFGSILENVSFKGDSREIDFNDRSRTENTRGSYPLTSLNQVYRQNTMAEAPKNIVFLMADAFGAMPAVARLDSWQAQYHFLSGYTAKLAGTEIGVKEPKAAFSTCFGAPFMPRHPSVYASLLADMSAKAHSQIWVLNTGWTGGGFGKGDRFPLTVSRALLSAIQSGELAKESVRKHPVFGFEVPVKCTGVDSKWLEIPMGDGVKDLGRKFDHNIQGYAAGLDPQIVTLGGPTLSL